LLATLGSEATGCDREAAEVWAIEVAVQRVGERRVGHEYEVYVLTLIVESSGRFSPSD
jgi:hypothetical protein